ncbi:MAG TPA: hypothetical protein VKB51_02295 [bacterium]|nr:hypothetical protein [bacterium]
MKRLPAARPPQSGAALLLALLSAGLLAMATVRSAAAAPAASAFAPPAALEWRAVFKLINLTTHAEPGEMGFVREGDDTRESNEQSFRLQLTGQPQSWLDYRFDYLNVKQDLGTAAPAQASGAELFRRKPLRWYLDRPETAPGQTPSTQTVRWYHEVDDAYVRLSGGPVEAVLGRQPITWGAGRIWQPTDIFAAFSPTALDTEYKPGIDGLLLNAYPSAFSKVQFAYILSPQDQPDVEDSAALRWRRQVGAESELTLLAGRVRGVPVGGGSFETSWMQAGWRLEGIAFRPKDRQDTAFYAIAGVDHQLSDGTVLLAELYHHSLGAASQGELPAVVQSQTFLDGRLLQLSRAVLAVSASRDFLGLWHGAYTLFASPLRDAAGQRHTSWLQQLAFTYSISDNAEAVFSLSTANGRGLAPDGSVQSEFGHVPNAFYVSLQFVL